MHNYYTWFVYLLRYFFAFANVELTVPIIKHFQLIWITVHFTFCIQNEENAIVQIGGYPLHTLWNISLTGTHFSKSNFINWRTTVQYRIRVAAQMPVRNLLDTGVAWATVILQKSIFHAPKRYKDTIKLQSINFQTENASFEMRPTVCLSDSTIVTTKY